MAIVVLPTAERLKEIRAFAEDKQVQTLIIMNQQARAPGLGRPRPEGRGRV